MKTFKDTLGEEWFIDFNIGEMKRIEERSKFYKLGIVIVSPEDTLTRIQDPMTLADILFVAIEPQAEERGIDSKEFGYRLAGDAIKEAKDAFTEAYIEFFPTENQRERIRTLAEKASKVGDEILFWSMERRETAMTEIRDRVKEVIEKETSKAVSGFGSGSYQGL